MTCRLVFEGDKIFLRIGPGDHTARTFEITEAQLKGIVLDALPVLLASQWKQDSAYWDLPS